MHHPDRLLHPLRRVGPKGSGQFARIRGTRRSTASRRRSPRRRPATAPRRCGRTSTRARWGWCSATASTGCATPWGTRAGSRRSASTLSDTGWIAGIGAKRGVDSREVGEHSDLVVIWGGNPVNTQVNVMTHARRAQASAARSSSWSIRTAPARRSRPTCTWPPRPAPTARWRARSCTSCSPRATPTGTTCARYTDAPDELAAHLPDPDARVGRRDHRADRRADRGRSPGSTGGPSGASSAATTASAASRNGAAQHARGVCLPAVTGAWQHPGGGAVYGQTGHLSARPQPDRGPRPAWTGRSARSTSRGSGRS